MRHQSRQYPASLEAAPLQRVPLRCTPLPLGAPLLRLFPLCSLTPLFSTHFLLPIMARDRPRNSPRQLQQPRCPSCGKRFTNVLRHLNHRQSTCANWFDTTIPHHASTHHCEHPTEVSPDSPISDDSYDIQQPLPSQQPQQSDTRVEFTGAAKAYGRGKTFMDRFDEDQYAGFRATNVHYPFAGRNEWELGSFLLSSGLSMRKIDEFLRLNMVISLLYILPLYTNPTIQIQDAGISFPTAKALRGRVELLPKVPDWKVKKISLKGYTTREPMFLFYRDALDCVEYLLGNPLFSDCMDFCPIQLYQDAE